MRLIIISSVLITFLSVFIVSCVSPNTTLTDLNLSKEIVNFNKFKKQFPDKISEYENQKILDDLLYTHYKSIYLMATGIKDYEGLSRETVADMLDNASPETIDAIVKSIQTNPENIVNSSSNNLDVLSRIVQNAQKELELNAMSDSVSKDDSMKLLDDMNSSSDLDVSVVNNRVSYIYDPMQVYPIRLGYERMTTIFLQPGEIVDQIHSSYPTSYLNVSQGIIGRNKVPYIRLDSTALGEKFNMIVHTNYASYFFDLYFLPNTSNSMYYVYFNPNSNYYLDFYKTIANVGFTSTDNQGSSGDNDTIQVTRDFVDSRKIQNQVNDIVGGLEVKPFADLYSNYTASFRFLSRPPFWSPTWVYDDGEYTYVTVPNLAKLNKTLKVRAYLSIELSKRRKYGYQVAYTLSGNYIVIKGRHRRLVLSYGILPRNRVYIDRLTEKEAHGGILDVEKVFKFD